MAIADQKIKEMQAKHNLKYLNKMYKMKEKISEFEQRKNKLDSKLTALTASIDKRLSHKKSEIFESVDQQSKHFQTAFRAHVNMDIAELKHMGEVEYNFNQMTDQIQVKKSNEMGQLNEMIKQTLNDEYLVYEKHEATRKLLLSQINYLKDRIKIEIESRRVSDDDIQHALDKYKELIASRIMQKRNDIKKRETD